VFAQESRNATLNIWTYTQNAPVAREFLADEYKKSGFFREIEGATAETARYSELLENGAVDAVPMPSGVYLIRGKTLSEPLSLIRAVIYADYKLMTEREMREHAARYEELERHILMSEEFEEARELYTKIDPATKQNGDICLARFIAKAFELDMLVTNRLIDRKDLSMEELSFFAMVDPLLREKEESGEYKNFPAIFFNAAERMESVLGLAGRDSDVGRYLAGRPKLPNMMMAVNLMDVGSEVIDGQVVYRNSLRKLRAMLPGFAEDGFEKIYIYGGLYEMGELSRKVHQVPDESRYFIRDGNATVMVERYLTKRKQMGNLTLKDSFGNPFSIKGMAKWNAGLSESNVEKDVNDLMETARALKIKMVADFIPWLSPGAISVDNYKMTFYSEISEYENNEFRNMSNEEEKSRWIERLLSRNGGRCAVRITEGDVERVILVHHLRFYGSHSSDQVMLNPYSSAVRQYYKDSLKRFIDLGFDEVRVDQAALLLSKNLSEYGIYGPWPVTVTNNDEMWCEVISFAKEYAMRKGKSIKLNMETYDSFEQGALLGMGADRVYDGDIFDTFYYLGRGHGCARALDLPVKKALEDGDRDLIYPTNFDQMSLKAIGGATKGFTMLLIALSHLGVNSMVDMREYLGEMGHIIPIVGGNNSGKDGHPFLEETELESRQTFDDLMRLARESEWKRLAMEFNRAVTTREGTDIRTLNNSDTERFFSIIWKTEANTWQMLTIDTDPAKPKTLVKVELPRDYVRINGDSRKISAFCAMPDGGHAEAGLSNWGDGENLSDVVEVPFGEREEYKLVTVVQDDSGAFYRIRAQNDRSFSLMDEIKKAAENLRKTVKESLMSFSASFGEVRKHICEVNDVSKLSVCMPIDVLKRTVDIPMMARGNILIARTLQKKNISFELVITGVEETDMDSVTALGKQQIKKLLNISDDFIVKVVTEKEMERIAEDFPSHGYDANTVIGRARIVKDMHEGKLKKGEYMAVVTDDMSEQEADEVRGTFMREEADNSRISFLLPVSSDGARIFLFSDMLNEWLKKVNKGDIFTVQKIMPPICSKEAARAVEQAAKNLWKVLSAA